MSDMESTILKLQSVVLTKEKQILFEEELNRYANATNWVIKTSLKNHLSKPSKIVEAISEQFFDQFDKRPEYLADIVKTACSEIARHRKLSITIRSMREKTPFFKRGCAIYSQPLARLSDRAVTITLWDKTHLPIPFDKFSRNKLANEISKILRGEPLKVDADGKMPLNQRYDRIRLIWNKEGFLRIDIRAKI